MASLDYRLNPLYTIRECSTCGALYNKSCGCSKGGLEDKFVHDPNKTPDSSQRPPQDCVKCGNPVEDLLNTSESSDDNTNVVNAPQEPFVVKQDPGENSSQSPPQINHNCCYECGDSLDGIFCQRCTCKSCGKGAHIGYNCPPKAPIISNPEPCNQTIDELPQTLPSFDPTCYSEKENSLPYVSKPNFVDDSPNDEVLDDIISIPPGNGNDHFNAESSLIESVLNRDNVISSPKIDFLIEEFAGENSNGSTTTHADFSQYHLFIFDLSIDLFPPVDRSDFYHEEFIGKLALIISPPEYDCFYFKRSRSGDVDYEEGSGSTRVVRRLVDRDILQLATVVHALG
ncbi:hypothetical protein Tco_0540568 [Tanacetum coccineum]